jgi:hypothetical protein
MDDQRSAVNAEDERVIEKFLFSFYLKMDEAGRISIKPSSALPAGRIRPV